MPRLLLFGASGAVGKALVRLLEAENAYTVHGTCRSNRPPLPAERCHRLDLEDFRKLESFGNDPAGRGRAGAAGGL